MSNPFFKNNGPFEINKLLKKADIKINDSLKNLKFMILKIFLMLQKKILLSFIQKNTLN